MTRIQYSNINSQVFILYEKEAYGKSPYYSFNKLYLFNTYQVSIVKEKNRNMLTTM